MVSSTLLPMTFLRFGSYIHAPGQLNDQATIKISLILMFMKYDMLKFENCLKEKHQMLTYFNFALSL